MRALYERVADELGRVDVLFNNAGINPGDDASVLETSLEAWQRVQDVNVRSVFLCCKHGIPHLLEAGGGSVINTASFVAVMGAGVSQISYTASKGAVLALSREMGVEFARKGCASTPSARARSTRRCSRSSSPRTPRRRRGAWSTSRWAASARWGDRRGALPRERRVARSSPASTFLVDGGLSAAYVTPEPAAHPARRPGRGKRRPGPVKEGRKAAFQRVPVPIRAGLSPSAPGSRPIAIASGSFR